ncbi:hypothetical protein CXZ10_04895 [Pleomorphomonas diazotrophica]|uniref:Uncharacterized protein n=1 Tax=Pleomorphomonas diazotrophica TaxID=1166257 RepID=A0A1I4QF81_9HYPH|nr:hypothetical protein [Pleomorphomonas diazotrophica]PKR90699.1 hypothetical protein CXZ10_04895 [Pleomorphomonas diazotrophica]SFM38782.1 hypothetical protein SAMN05192571_101334 [Pleomorphomonas diazotrophica]
MTSFLVESILLIALIGTIAGLLVFRRELRELKSHQATYASSLDETGVALMTVGNAIREINMQGLTTLQNLIVEIERARSMLDELEKAAGLAPAEPTRRAARTAGR